MTPAGIDWSWSSFQYLHLIGTPAARIPAASCCSKLTHNHNSRTRSLAKHPRQQRTSHPTPEECLEVAADGRGGGVPAGGRVGADGLCNAGQGGQEGAGGLHHLPGGRRQEVRRVRAQVGVGPPGASTGHPPRGASCRHPLDRVTKAYRAVGSLPLLGVGPFDVFSALLWAAVAVGGSAQLTALKRCSERLQPMTKGLLPEAPRRAAGAHTQSSAT